MNSTAPNAARRLPEVRGARASSVIVHRVPPEKVEIFMELERGITGDVGEFPGYQETEIYPPADARKLEWIVILHFDRADALQRWHDSHERAAWIEKFRREFGEFQIKKVPSGFGSWFAGLSDDGRLPPHWKMFLTVLVSLYPLVMLLAIFVTPYTVAWFGLAVAMLIGNALSVALLEWWGGPALNGLLAPWLRANGEQGRPRSVMGLVMILIVLGVMTLLFRQVTG